MLASLLWHFSCIVTILLISCRFFFISDDELLSVLGTADPTSIQEHMLKLFDNCASLIFNRGNKAVTGMTSSEVRQVWQHASLACMLSHHALPLSIADTPVLHDVLGRFPAHMYCLVRLQAQRTDHWVVYVLQGEAFDFGTPVVIDGAVEVWMSAVEKEMRTTLHRSSMLKILTE